MIDAITDPDSLAEEACKVDLIHPESKKILQSLPVDAKTKARSLLQTIEGKINGQPVLFHHFLALLKKLPGLAELRISLQDTYGKDITLSLWLHVQSESDNAICITFEKLTWVEIHCRYTAVVLGNPKAS